jgi:hypothetical protein
MIVKCFICLTKIDLIVGEDNQKSGLKYLPFGLILNSIGSLMIPLRNWPKSP